MPGEDREILLRVAQMREESRRQLEKMMADWHASVDKVLVDSLTAEEQAAAEIAVAERFFAENTAWADADAVEAEADRLVQEAAIANANRYITSASHRRRRDRAYKAVDLWAAILPSRIVNEDLGDYLEDIHRRCAVGQRWCVYARLVTTIFWTGLNAIGYALKAVGKKSTG